MSGLSNPERSEGVWYQNHAICLLHPCLCVHVKKMTSGARKFGGGVCLSVHLSVRHLSPPRPLVGKLPKTNHTLAPPMWRFVADKISQLLKTVILMIFQSCKVNLRLQVPQGDQLGLGRRFLKMANPGYSSMKTHCFPQKWKIKFTRI